MTWAAAASVVAVAVVLLVVPGAVVAWVAGLRGVLVLAVAPLVSVSVVGPAAVVAELVGVPWGWKAFAGGSVAASAGVGLVAGGMRVLARHRRMTWLVSLTSGVDSWSSSVSRRLTAGEPWSSSAGWRASAGDPWSSWLWAVGGALVAGAALAAGVARGVGSPDRWPQTFDAVFHLDAAWHVLTTGDGSSLTLGTMTAPEARWGFYPAAWHDLVAVVADLTGSDVVTATSVSALVTVAVAWPLACVALARVALGSRGAVLGAAGVLSATVTASPVLLVSYGTLWPNALSTAVLPAALALVLAVVLRPSGIGPAAAAIVLLAVVVPGLALVHPNAVVSLLVLGLAGVAAATWSWGRRARVASVAAGVAVAWLVGWSPVFAGTRGTSWGARQTTGQALGEWLALAPERTPVPLVAAVLALGGAVVAWRRRRLRWLVAVHVAGGGLWVLVSGSDGRVSRLVSGPWYDDAFRLGALVGVAGVPLAALGLVALAETLVRLSVGLRDVPLSGPAGSDATTSDGSTSDSTTSSGGASDGPHDGWVSDRRASHGAIADQAPGMPWRSGSGPPSHRAGARSSAQRRPGPTPSPGRDPSPRPRPVSGVLLAEPESDEGPAARSRAAAVLDDPAPSQGPSTRPRAVGAVVLAGLVALVVGSGGLYRDETARVVGRWASSEAMLGPAERDLVASVGRWVPAGERVAGNPWDGMAFTGPLADREALFPHLAGRWGADRDLVAASLSSVSTRPDVCAALSRLDVGYVLVGASTFWPSDGRRAAFAGLEVAGRPGFSEVASSGSASLWRITACG